jgi:hypothetical protein
MPDSPSRCIHREDVASAAVGDDRQRLEVLVLRDESERVPYAVRRQRAVT